MRIFVVELRLIPDGGYVTETKKNKKKDCDEKIEKIIVK
jgi:hypothetical protein